jgi:hypothetical protein
MAKRKKIEVMYDDASINVSAEVDHIWSIANTLRGTYSSDKYKNVVIPMIIIRRLERSPPPHSAPANPSRGAPPLTKSTEALPQTVRGVLTGKAPYRPQTVRGSASGVPVGGGRGLDDRPLH